MWLVSAKTFCLKTNMALFQPTHATSLSSESCEAAVTKATLKKKKGNVRKILLIFC